MTRMMSVLRDGVRKSGHTPAQTRSLFREEQHVLMKRGGSAQAQGVPPKGWV